MMIEVKVCLLLPQFMPQLMSAPRPWTFKRAHVNNLFDVGDAGSWEDHDWPEWTLMVGATQVTPARFILEQDVDPSSNDNQYLVLTLDEEEGEEDDGVISYWSEDDGDWFIVEMEGDFPNKGEVLYDITEAMHIWEPIKDEDRSTELKTLFEEEDEKTDFITPGMVLLNNWTWVGFSENEGKKVCNASPNVLLKIFNRMNFDLAYFDVSYNIEILHLNDSNEFENEINKQLEKKIKPMESTFETLNLSNDENPRLIKTSSTLKEKERKDLKELVTEFQEVFVWSYKDMPSIDPKIALHHIDTHAHMVPVKKKLRRIRTEWRLKIKEGVTKQL